MQTVLGLVEDRLVGQPRRLVDDLVAVVGRQAVEDDGVVVVKLYKYTFCPLNVTVKPGTTVRWVNVDKRTSHSVWLKQAGVAESERFFPEEQWEFPFITPGEYPYLCGPHWDQEDMRGFVRVVE